MRRLALLLCALVLAVAVAVPVGLSHATTVHAANCGNPFDSEGTIYDDGYVRNGFDQTVGYPGNFHPGNTDLRAWRYIDPGQHDCYRGFETSVWLQDQYTTVDVSSVLRVWICGTFAGDAFWGAHDSTWRAASRSVNWNGTGGTIQNLWVADSFPSGNSVMFFRYGSCGKQVDNRGGSINHFDFSNAVFCQPGQYGYFNESNL